MQTPIFSSVILSWIFWLILDFFLFQLPGILQKYCKSIPAMTQEESMSIEDNWRGRKLREYAARGVFAEWKVGYTQLNNQCCDAWFHLIFSI